MMHKFLAIFTATLKLVLVYRARTFIWFLVDVLPVLASILFVMAVFSDTGSLGEYTRSSILTYYLVVMALGTVLESHPEFAISADINQGFLATYLLRPLSYWRYYAANELAFKVFRFIYLVPLGSVLVWLAADALAVSVPSWWFWCLFLLMVVLSFWTYYFLKIIVGFMAFWFTEIWWLIGGLEVMNLLFSGFMIPVDLMPVAFQKISAALPFQYLIYLPTQTILGKLQVNQIGLAIGVQLFWLLTIAWLARWVWRKGIKNYTAYGN